MTIKSGKDFIKLLEDLRDANDIIAFFEVVCHGVTYDTNEPALGISLGDDTFGIGSTEPDEDTGGTWYGIEDYSGLLGGGFDPSAVIELEACHSAHGKGSIGYAFKKHLPSASVWGYTGNCSFDLPFGLPWIWETHESWIDPDSEWVEIFL